MLCKVFRRSSVFVARREAVQGLIFMRAVFAGLCVVARREAVHGPIFINDVCPHLFLITGWLSYSSEIEAGNVSSMA